MLPASSCRKPLEDCARLAKFKGGTSYGPPCCCRTSRVTPLLTSRLAGHRPNGWWPPSWTRSVRNT